jgi:hypothetical protein
MNRTSIHRVKQVTLEHDLDDENYARKIPNVTYG